MDDRAPSSTPPSGVAERLEELRRLYVAETDSEARCRLAAGMPVDTPPFAVAVARRLAELGALCDLAKHLRRHT
jgi:hypothetical protein